MATIDGGLRMAGPRCRGRSSCSGAAVLAALLATSWWPRDAEAQALGKFKVKDEWTTIGPQMLPDEGEVPLKRADLPIVAQVFVTESGEAPTNDTPGAQCTASLFRPTQTAKIIIMSAAHCFVMPEKRSAKQLVIRWDGVEHAVNLTANPVKYSKSFRKRFDAFTWNTARDYRVQLDEMLFPGESVSGWPDDIAVVTVDASTWPSAWPLLEFPALSSVAFPALTPLQRGDKVVLVGGGCSEPDVKRCFRKGALFGIYKSEFVVAEATLASRFTVQPAKSARVSVGDSGGAAFALSDTGASLRWLGVISASLQHGPKPSTYIQRLAAFEG